MTTLFRTAKGAAQLLRPLRSAANWLRRNTRAGSKRNISAHYGLSNEFFALMLDPTMTYSSGVFSTPTSTLEEASIEKYDRICRKLQLTPADHVLEIGTGWGGFAEHAVKFLGFADRFIRTWHYYLCYCEAGFLEREIGVSQLLLTKPSCRRQPIVGFASSIDLE